MNHLRILTLKESEKWHSIVRSFGQYDVCYLPDYARAFSRHGEGEPLLVYFENGSCRAVNVVMKRDIAEAFPFAGKLPPETFYDISTPYGYGGFWIEGEYSGELDAEYRMFCGEQGFISEFVRFHLFTDARLRFDGYTESNSRNVVRSLKGGLEELFGNFEHKVRKNIKRAVASGLEIERDPSGERIEDFLRIYYATMQRNQAGNAFFFPKDFFETLQRMKGNFQYFHVLHDGKVVSTELVLYGTENCYSFLGGTESEYYHLRPNEFLKFEIMRWALEQGLKRFVLGGGYGADDGIFRYKKSFAPGGIVDFYIGKKILDGTRYDRLLEMREIEGHSKISSETCQLSGFFPRYRA
jgi:hypothetical protein